MARSRLVALALATSAVACGLQAGPAAAYSWRPNVRAAARYAANRSGVVDFAVAGLGGGLRGRGVAHTAPAASVFKVMLLASYLRRPGVRNRPLHRSDRRLLRPMIRRSDSVAATRVRDIVGVARIQRLARSAHMRDFHYNPIWGLSRTSPRDQARFMLHLERFIPRRHRPFAMRQLSHIVPGQRWGVGRVRHRGWALYFKGGWGSGSGRVDHQVVLLRRGGHRLALAIFTQFDPGHSYGKQTLRGVARRLLAGLPG
jgi:Beta-lactamase enzyme family